MLNTYKELWRAAEEQSEYPEDPEFIAAFVLRFAYQQQHWNISIDKMGRNFRRTIELFGGNSNAAKMLRQKFEDSAGISLEAFQNAAELMYYLFTRYNGSIADHALIDSLGQHFNPDQVSKSLNILSTTRRQFREYYEEFAATEAVGVPYEFNPLLRYPIMLRDNYYWCVFPQLINYAATRGLYFYIADLVGPAFNAAFAEAFEDYLQKICTKLLGSGCVITEKEERDMGWTGKTNDLTLILGDSAILFECKNSGLFSVSKRSGNPDDLAADIRKNLANSANRKGLFQLYDKIENIRNGNLPPQLNARYAAVKKFYPVVLLHDEIWFANRPETLKNLIDTELRNNGIDNFIYQIWHIEELEILLNVAAKNEILGVIEEKFSDQRFECWIYPFICPENLI
jgi:hypothetical protein